MSNYSKSYIGKGRQHKTLEIVTVTINLAEIEKFAYEYEGQKLLTFDVAKLQQPDQYGKTHTAYVSVKQEEEKPAEKEPETKPTQKRGKK